MRKTHATVHADLRHIEARDGCARQTLRSPEKDEDTPPIELTSFICGRWFAFEAHRLKPRETVTPMAGVGRILNWSRRLKLQGYQIGADEGCGHQFLGRMDEESFHLELINNGAPAQRKRGSIWSRRRTRCRRLDRYASPIAPGMPAPPAFDDHRRCHRRGVRFFQRHGDARPAGRANWDRFRSIRPSAQTPAKRTWS
jgi:hypothetical protein